MFLLTSRGVRKRTDLARGIFRLTGQEASGVIYISATTLKLYIQQLAGLEQDVQEDVSGESAENFRDSEDISAVEAQ